MEDLVTIANLPLFVQGPIACNIKNKIVEKPVRVSQVDYDLFLPITLSCKGHKFHLLSYCAHVKDLCLGINCCWHKNICYKVRVFY